ncbi:MAG: arsenate reductase (glutaredoxin) [Bacteroidales bacterium]|nr:arsenate reductase (glutaredoxin) [Bacteroidales bacterium]MCF8457501.1 arsenate reductase (glutaredoxin) [Bacteroidales bacterium]
MMKIYHNPRCKKSRAGLQYLQEKGIEFEVIEYLKDEFTQESFKNVLMLLNKKPHDLIRTQEEMYKKELKGRNFTDDEWVKIMVENPRLISRPIVCGKYKAVLAQPPEYIDELLHN